MIAQLSSLPPIRTELQDPMQIGPDGQPQTAKEWYYFWRDSQDRINTLTELVTYGTSAGRPDPTAVPDGALYVEQDRGGIIYQMQGGAWHYLAGTMWGTLNPDQRPTGLGVNDAGFEFRSTDTNPAYAPRQFLWSGNEWIETTMVLYGTHAARPAADEKTPPRTIYVETDRSGVIYQQQANAWHYLAGTMYGTISPDQRPTDLGANDSGFRYRGTDQAREYIWSGTVWVETGDIVENQGSALPVRGVLNFTGPGVTATDDTVNLRTNITIAGGNTFQFAAATGTLTMTTAIQDVPGAALTLTKAGQYWVQGVFDFAQGGADQGFTFQGFLAVNGVAANGIAVFTPQYVSGGGNRVTAAQQWLVTVASGNIVKLQASKSGGTGTSIVISGNTTVSALWISS